MKRSNDLRLLDVPAGKRKWNPVVVEKCRKWLKDQKKPAADSGKQKGNQDQ